MKAKGKNAERDGMGSLFDNLPSLGSRVSIETAETWIEDCEAAIVSDDISDEEIDVWYYAHSSLRLSWGAADEGLAYRAAMLAMRR